MDYRSSIRFVSNLRTRQQINHFAELYNIDLTGLNSNPAMIAKIKEVLKWRNENNIDLKDDGTKQHN
ncbi:MAG: hypothetical protein HDS50_00110 [Bacteroides sp.]|nr:hypothetical protein [Bacteroides sp.]